MNRGRKTTLHPLILCQNIHRVHNVNFGMCMNLISLTAFEDSVCFTNHNIGGLILLILETPANWQVKVQLQIHIWYDKLLIYNTVYFLQQKRVFLHYFCIVFTFVSTFSKVLTQLTFTGSNSLIETLEKGVKYVM